MGKLLANWEVPCADKWVMSLTNGYHYHEGSNIIGGQADDRPEKGGRSHSLHSVSCGQAPSLWLKRETQLFPTHGFPQLQHALFEYLQINLPLQGIWAGLVGKVLQLSFPQWVFPGSHCGVTGCGGPWGGLAGGDLVGAICPPSLGVVQTWAGVLIGKPSGWRTVRERETS